MAIMAFHTPNAGISFGPALPLYGDSSQCQISVPEINKGQKFTKGMHFLLVLPCLENVYPFILHTLILKYRSS